jgi:streptomycin 6-kinase
VTDHSVRSALEPPETLRKTIINVFGDRGLLFLESLPALIDRMSTRWQLSDLRLSAGLSYNLVFFARRGDQDVVLKLGVPNNELTSEITALGFFAGRGAVRPLESDAESGALLLERLEPGRLLVEVTDDEQAMHIAADVMQALWRPAPSDPALIQLESWFKGFENLRSRYGGGTGPLSSALVERAEADVTTFFGEPYVKTLLHGDLHHFNILQSGDRWLAIDPKGVVGPAAYEVGPLLLNPWGAKGLGPDIGRVTDRRIEILADRLRVDKKRLREWGIAHAVLSAIWSLEGKEDWRPAMEIGAILAGAH